MPDADLVRIDAQPVIWALTFYKNMQQVGSPASIVVNEMTQAQARAFANDTLGRHGLTAGPPEQWMPDESGNFLLPVGPAPIDGRGPHFKP